MVAPSRELDELLIERAAARAEIERRAAASQLSRYIPMANPSHQVPKALEGICKVWDRIHAGEQVFAFIEGPPRVYKTTTCFHGMIRDLQEDSSIKLGYGTYTIDVARQRSLECRDMAERAGIWVGEEQVSKSSRFAISKSMSHWATRGGGGGRFFGRGGGVIGSGFDLMFIDDPIKDWEEYGSPLKREQAAVWSLAMLNRLEPSGSYVIGHHRWGNDDPIGVIRKQVKDGYPDVPEELRGELEGIDWTEVSLAAVAVNDMPDGRMLPDFDRPLIESGWYTRVELVRRYAAAPERFMAQFCQRTQRDGSKLFPEMWAQWEPHRDDRGEELGMTVGDDWFPTPNLTGKILVFGGDTAGSEDSSSDWTAITLGAFSWEWSEELQESEAVMDVLWCWFERLLSPDVVDFAARLCRMLPEATFAYEVGSQGSAQFQFLKRDYPHARVYPVRASTSKRARCIPLSSAAKRQRARLPPSAPWLREWHRQVDNFTGLGGVVKDDIPDSAAHAYNFFVTRTRPTGKTRSGGKRRLTTDGALGDF